MHVKPLNMVGISLFVLHDFELFGQNFNLLSKSIAGCNILFAFYGKIWITVWCGGWLVRHSKNLELGVWMNQRRTDMYDGISSSIPW